MREIFVSHSEADRHLAEMLVYFLIEAVGVPPKSIFCSSLEGFGNPLTYDFNANMRDQIQEPKLVVLLLTPSYFDSRFCMMELGATWAKSLKALPVVVPPTTFAEVTTTIGLTQAWDITNSGRLQHVRETVVETLGIDGQDQHVFDRKREQWKADLPTALSNLKASPKVPREVLEGVQSLLNAAERSLVEVTKKYEHAERALAAMAPLRPRVLIIEDEPLIAQDLEGLLEKSGYVVEAIARTASEALAAWEKHRPNIIIADIVLADGSSGIEATNKILANGDAAVTFATAFPERLLSGKRPEPVHLVTKPWNPDTLLSTVKLSYEQYVARQAR